MKHYRIGITAGRHRFEYACNTISEAYGAIQDAVIHFGLKQDLDNVMVVLASMRKGERLSHVNDRLKIEVADGEV